MWYGMMIKRKVAGMGRQLLPSAIIQLQEQFSTLNWAYFDSPAGSTNEKMYRWPGDPREDILICVHKLEGVQELFHRHDFFYFNFTYKGQYDSLSYKYNSMITIREGELYVGQPFAGHALCVHDNQETIIFGVLIQKNTFFHSFLPMLSANSKLFHFFLDPATNHFSEEYLHFHIEDDCNIRALLEMMVVEYAYKQGNTQDVLRPLVLAFLMQIARQYARANPPQKAEILSEQIMQYMSEHFGTITLKDIAVRFSYHPNYLSALLHRDLGKTFSEILLDLRMQRATTLLRETSLSNEEIALMLGYGNNSNFYKAFKGYYGYSPRELQNSSP